MSDGETGGSFVEPRGGTQPLNPIPERAFAPVFPYRGMQQHGVPVDAQPWIPQDAEAQSWEGEVVYDPEHIPLQPIPVVIVNESEEEIRSWRAVTHSVRMTGASLVVGQNPRMTRVRLRNTSDATDTDMIVWVGHESNVGRLSGWPIYPGEQLEICAEEEVYAILDPNASTADYADLSIIIEHRVG